MMGEKSLSILIFVSVAVLFFLWRAPFPLFWDDSPIVAERLYDNLQTHGSHFNQVLRNSFGRLTPSGYRPISEGLRQLGINYFSNPKNPPLLWYAFISVFYGFFALGFYLVAMQFIYFPGFGLLALFLFLASSAHLCASWVVFAGVQILVPLWLCWSLIIYWKWDVARGALKVFLAVLLFLFLFVAPWVREFTGLASVLILFIEWLQKRRLGIATIIALLSLGHAIFPTAWVGAFFFPGLPIQSIFNQGSLGAQLSVSALKTEVFPIFLLLIPSPLVLLYVVSLFRRKLERQIFAHFLWFWMLSSLLPFLATYTSQVHLAYSLVPASILIMQSIERLIIGSSRFWRLAFAFLLVWGIADQALNIYSGFQVTKGILSGDEAVGRWMKNNIPEGSLVVTNALHGEDIRYLSGSHADFFYSMASAVNSKTKIVDDSEKLKKFLNKRANEHEIYFLQADFEFMPDKFNYHCHKFVRHQCVNLTKGTLIHNTIVRYPFLDPLKLVVPRRFVPFLSSPDLENDFYRGPARNRVSFFREVSTQYWVYKVTGRTVNCHLDATGQILTAPSREKNDKVLLVDDTIPLLRFTLEKGLSTPDLYILSYFFKTFVGTTSPASASLYSYRVSWGCDIDSLSFFKPTWNNQWIIPNQFQLNFAARGKLSISVGKESLEQLRKESISIKVWGPPRGQDGV
ncbi:MAG: hypothetical protein HY537_15850 [Deltaproteobacteria bacterium]|nr:hypothetical protein [Deltaproteobacteria bacterium]